jgi:hypothetical protein
MEEIRKNKSDVEWTYPMMGRVPLMDLASWQEEGGDRLGRRRLWERKINNGVKAYSGSHLIQSNLVPQTYLMDGSYMSDGLRLNNLS